MSGKKELSIGEICRRWAKEPRAVSDPLDILTILLQGFWLGSLKNTIPIGGGRSFSREDGLKSVAAQVNEHEHPGIMICRNREELDLQFLYENGKIAEVDVRFFIYVPRDTADWTVQIRQKTYEDLAKCEASTYASGFLEAFRTLKIDKTSFLNFIHSEGLEPPWFWYENPTSTLPKNHDVEVIDNGAIQSNSHILTADEKGKGGRGSGRNPWLQEAINRIVEMRYADGTVPTLESVWAWLVENAAEGYEFDPPIDGCDDLSIEDDRTTLRFIDREGRANFRKKRSLEPYIATAKKHFQTQSDSEFVNPQPDTD